MTNLQKEFLAAAQELNLAIELDYELSFNDGTKICVPIWLPDLGSDKGMHVFCNDQLSGALREKLSEDRISYTFMTEPSSVQADLSDYKEIFVDWGWEG